MKKVVCPNCGESIGREQRLKAVIDFCKESWGQCSCGQKYHVRLSTAGTLVLSFLEKQKEIVR
jgi:hypothetical protein